MIGCAPKGGEAFRGRRHFQEEMEGVLVVFLIT